MARTKEEIFQDLIVRKEADAVLQAIMSSNSKASFYQTLFALIADLVGDFELTFDDFTANLDALLESKQVHNATWWRRTALAFQLGDSLEVQANGNLAYPVLNADLQIIKRAAVITTNLGNLELKVAKLDTDNVTPIPLTSAERSAFTSYIDDIGPSGIVVTITSQDGDEINGSFRVLIDTEIINLSDGTLLSDPTIKPVEVAIQNYLATFQNDDFGGTFFVNKLIESILGANGVLNVTVLTLNKKSPIEPSFSDVLALTGRKFITASGYVKLQTGFDLSANITYVDT